jgi:hypothetical protein
MKRRAMNMFAATNEDLPLFSGAVVSVEVQEFAPVEVQEEVKPLPMFEVEPAEYSDDGMDGYYKGCMIHITMVEQWTVGPCTSYRVDVEHGMDLRREYATSLAEAHRKAEHLAHCLTWKELA